MAASEEKDFDPTLDSVELNTARVMGHVIEKGFQLGGVLGSVLVAPITVFRQSRKGLSPRAALPLAAGAIYKTVLASTALTGAMGAVRLAQLEDLKAGVEDRAYRLHYNQGQNRADLFARVGSAAGVATAAALLPISVAPLVAGGAVGAAVALVAHVGTKPAQG
ncbi:hypothetical protein ABPG77_001186 [Micractinium sp. CCAP 211/92]